MNDQIESALDANAERTFSQTGSKIILAFAIYGAASAIQDTVNLTKKVLRNRKADETPVEKSETPPEQ